MADIRHRIGVSASNEQVYDVLASREGLSGWWTRDVRGDSSVDGSLEFFFGKPQPSAVMEVAELVPGRRISWRCVQGPEEWVGTDVSFDLESANGETVVTFKHGGWREPIAFMDHCSTKWAYFLLGLKASLEGEAATLHAPYPEDKKISSWG